MKKIIKLLPLFVILSFSFLIFKNWFMPNPLSSGDWTYAFLAASKGFSAYPQVWNTHFFGGLGGAIPFILGLETFFLATSKLLSQLNLNWILIERLIWFWPYLTLSFFSSYFLFKSFFKISFYSVIASLIFVTNTYALMLASGGQMGVALAYAISPFVIGYFVRFSNENKYLSIKSNFLESVFFGGLLAIISAYDLRITYIVLAVLFLYAVIVRPFTKKTFFRFLSFVFLIPTIIIVLLNAFWTFPFAALSSRALDAVPKGSYVSIESVRFFSFAKFENTISLLHPNWPENIFGKVSFLRPEFLIIPILAFISLFFVLKDKKNYKTIGFLSFLGIFGAFLAKGTNDPFGNVYELLFTHFPGFFMFRDSTKWYLVVIISYSILIPYSLYNISLFLNKKNKIKNWAIFIVFLIFWAVLIREGVLGQLSGTFKKQTVPAEYVSLADKISRDHAFYRTLYVPAYERYGFVSDQNPALSSDILFNTSDIKKIISKLNDPKTETQLSESGVRYIIIPSDPQKEIYINDRKYDDSIRASLVKEIDKISWLSKSPEFNSLNVYELKGARDHFFIMGPGKISIKAISSSEYQIDLQNVEKGERIVFSDAYSKDWIMLDQENLKSSTPYNNFNSWNLSKSGDYSVKVYYGPQKWVGYGLIVSAITAGVIFTVLIWLHREQKK